MITITKSEKEAISARLPGVHIVRTMKHKSKRHHDYCEETKQVMKLLSTMRKTGYTTNADAQKVGANGEYRTKTK